MEAHLAIGRKEVGRGRCGAMEDFIVTHFRDKPRCKSVLGTIRGRCQSMPDLEPLGLRAVERLEDLHRDVVRLNEDDPSRVQYVEILVRLVKVTYKRPLLVRLAKCDTIAQMIGKLQVDIDDLARSLGRGDDERQMTRWRDEWKGSRAEQFSVLKRLTTEYSDRQMKSEFKHATLLEEAMMELNSELGKNLPQEQLELKQHTLERVIEVTKMQEETLPYRLISVNELIFQDGSDVVGSFGMVRRATWYHDGVNEKVVVKKVLNGIAGDARDSFTRQLKMWRDLPAHPNILKLHGGCSHELRQFYVCEEAAKGNLKDFCRVKRSSVLVWSMMVQVAEGLAFLHEHGIVHGGLSCQNILIDSNNTPKLSDFGFSAIRSLSMGMSVSRYHFQIQPWNGAPGADGMSTQRVEADIYALGMCISEALEQTIPFRDGGTDSSSNDIRQIVSRLCAANYRDRPPIADAIEMMRSIYSAATSFPIEGLKGSPSSVKTLADMPIRCLHMPETEILCRQVIDHLTFLHDAVAALATVDPIKRKYSDVVVRTVKLLRRKPLLQRLASSETIVTTIHELQLQLSDVAQDLGLADTPEAQRWQQQWDADRAEHFDKLNQLVTGASERFLVYEFRDEQQLQEVLMSLNSGMRWKDQPAEVLELKQTTLSRVLAYLKQTELRMFDWFIPIDDIECEGTEIMDTGTFGKLCRGTLIHEGQRIEVAVMLLFNEALPPSKDAFLNQLDEWWSLPDNDHTLKLYGGSHLSEPMFYVSPLARYGSLGEFLTVEEHMKFYWQLFYQVAQSLKFLHDRQIIHGNLTCRHILIDNNYSTKLTIFGKDIEEEETLGLSGITQIRDLRKRDIRWKPREVLQGNYYDEKFYESDIYSLGICMIEARTQEAPFGFEDEDTVLHNILSGERHPRPEGLSDAEWDFISRLCDQDYTKRPTLDEVLRDIEKFAVKEEAEMSLADFPIEPAQRTSTVHPIPETATQSTLSSVCSSCTESSDGSQQSCRCCGFSLKISSADVTRHSFATYVKSHTKDEALQRLREIAVTLQDLRDQGFVHANVLPGSIRIGRDGCAQLVGFEYSKTLDELAHGLVPQRENGVRYLAPECLSGKNPSFASDVYSLGMCAIYALSGEPPWGLLVTDGDTKFQICSNHAIPVKPDTILGAEWKLIEQMCTFDPADRMHIHDVARHLSELVSKHNPTTPPWSLLPDTVRYPDKNASISITSFVSRYLGMWKDAEVLVEAPKETLLKMGRSFHSVADLWFSLKHPTVHQLYGAINDDIKPIFICETTEHGDMTSYVGSNTEDTHIWSIFTDVALAVHYMHNRGIVHGNVSLRNILVMGSGRGRLSGFLLSFHRSHYLCQRSPEDEPTTGEEWRPAACGHGHYAGFEADVYWLGRCIIDAIGGELVDREVVPSDSTPCALCLLGQVVSRPENFTTEEWRLVSDMCCGKIKMAEVVDRLTRLSAVNRAVQSKLNSIATPLPPHARQAAQEMMLAAIHQFEEEDNKQQLNDEIDDLDLDDGTNDDNVQNTVIPIEKYIVDGSNTVLDCADFIIKLLQYDPTKSYLSALGPSHFRMPSVQRKKSPYKWTIDHENINEIRVGKINTGACASVWRGMWLGAPVALKKLFKPDQGQNLREESNLWFRVRHPRVVDLFGSYSTDCHVFVCDLIEGGRLDEYKIHPAKNKKLTEVDTETMWGFLQDAAIGLQGLHGYGIVHADLKCDNILVTTDGRAKLIDFGLSCLSTCDGGRCQGAQRWKAPECLEGQGPTFESDVFSFGMCIVQAISGVYPWGTVPDGSVAFQVKQGKLPKQPASFTPLQWELVKRMCRFNPSDRLDLDFVVKVLGYFAKLAPYVNDESVRVTLTNWESDLPAVEQSSV
ncbi:unnamed protein product [Phytophthora fragariaefolia]|uniref:Unnamed protein product n=1 Tax=Phytophthora fragariaefolia TaxID=1490495 RepID=A0A9W7CUJ7_9STRA|nr:unnamed protein product [Phytophthora fragariaefolia]